MNFRFQFWFRMRPFVELILYEKSIMRKQLRQSSHQPKAKGMRQERSGRGGRGRGRRGEQKRRKKKWKKNTKIKLNKNLIYVMRWLKHKHVDWILNWRKKKNSRGHWRKFFFFLFFSRKNDLRKLEKAHGGGINVSVKTLNLW